MEAEVKALLKGTGPLVWQEYLDRVKKIPEVAEWRSRQDSLKRRLTEIAGKQRLVDADIAELEKLLEEKKQSAKDWVYKLERAHLERDTLRKIAREKRIKLAKDIVEKEKRRKKRTLAKFNLT